MRFTGHEGALDTTIANPRLVLDGDRGALFLDVSGTTQDGRPITAQGIEFADLELAAAQHEQDGDSVVISGIPATLTAAGAAAFGTYEAGEALDPVTVEIVGGGVRRAARGGRGASCRPRMRWPRPARSAGGCSRSPYCSRSSPP